MHYIELFTASAGAHAQAPALRDCARTFTYAELAEKAGRVAAKLRKTGCTPGRFVMISMDRQLEYIAAYLGILTAGCAAVPVTPQYPAERLEFIRRECDAAEITEAFFDDLAAYEPMAPDADGGAPALLLYTSGSTGAPKGILYTGDDLANAAQRLFPLYAGVEPLRYCGAAPLSFIALVKEYLSVFLLGGCAFMVTEQVRRDPALLAGVHKKYNITAGFVSPRMYPFYHRTAPNFCRVLTGSERLSNIWSPDFETHCIYGMSEVGLVSDFRIDRPYDNTPAGKALPGIELWVCGEEDTPLPAGQEGEICVVGELHQCYYKDPEKTARAFRKLADGRTCFRTGDVGYLDENGDLIYVNRRDWMVKVNGQRVETLEIEVLLQQQPTVETAAVKAFTDEDGQTYLTAYYVSAEEQEAALRGALAEKLPEYMIPRFFVRMDALPKNVNGKLDRTALQAPEAACRRVAYAAPENDAQQAVCDAFRAVLRCGRVGIHDDFTALGGDSIKALKLADHLSAFGLAPDIILGKRTPEAIAAVLQEASAAPVDRVEAGETVPLTNSQRGVYLESMADPDSVAFNIEVLMTLPAGTDEERFLSAVRTVAEAHPIFHAVFVTPEGVPSMTLRPRPVVITRKTVGDPEAECRAFLRPFDLEHGPLYRFELLRCGDRLYFLYDVHHIIWDGTSVNQFAAQIAQVYNGGDCPAEPMSLFDLSRAEQAMPGTAEYREAQEYYKQKFQGVDCAALPSDVTEEHPARGCDRFAMPAEGLTVREVRAFTHANGISENALFMGAFAYALAKFGGGRECLFSTVHHGRHDPRLLPAMGMFVKTLPMYCTFEDNTPTADFLRGVYNDYYQHHRHDCVDYGELAQNYGVRSQIFFVFQSELFNDVSLDCGKMTVELLDTGESNEADLDVMLLRDGEGYSLLIHHRRGFYSEAMARSLSDAFLTAARSMLTAGTMGEVELLSPRAEAVYAKLNDNDTPVENVTYVSLLEKWAARQPEKTAVVAAGESLTYRELNEAANRVANRLLALGVGRDDIIGMVLERTKELPVTEFGIQKAGGAFLGMLPGYPDDRIEFCLTNAGSPFVITSRAILEARSGLFGSDKPYKALAIEDLLTGENTEDPGLALDPEQLAYCIYTSGSTGTPKGVMLTHGNLSHYLQTLPLSRNFYQREDCTGSTLSVTSVSFDMSLDEFGPALSTGKTLCIATEDEIHDPILLASLMQKNHVQCMTCTPSYLNSMVDIPVFAEAAKGLVTLVVGAEAFPGSLYGKLKALAPDLQILNGYGPTEATICCSVKELTGSRGITIGRPTGNVKFYVTDKAGRVLPPYACGELIICGPNVGRGYVKLPEKTAASFFRMKGLPAYHSGDLVRLNGDAEIDFRGRLDNQVKLRGFRVELDEIEKVLCQFDAVKQAKVILCQSGAGDFLAGYFTAVTPVDLEALTDFLKARLTYYMVPSVLMQLEQMPMTPNGKVDKKALPVPQRRMVDAVAPENDTQQKIFDVVAEVIGHREFGVETDLYEAGLTSIGAVKLNVELAEAFTVPIRIADIKANSTVKKLERFLAAAAPAAVYEKQADYPITQTQNGIFIECMANPESTIYNIPVLVKVADELDSRRLAEAVRAAVNAHSYLKATLFTDAGGNIRAARHDEDEVFVPVLQCEALPSERELVQPFTLLGSPLYRLAIYETPADKYLFMDVHHILCDGTSEQILFRDISRAYAGETLTGETFSGFEAGLEDEAIHAGDRYVRAKAYWKDLLTGCDTGCLPKKEPEARSGSGLVRYSAAAGVPAILAYCEKHGLTLNAYFNAVFVFVLSRFANKESLTYATIYNGRNDSRLTETVTLAVKTIPVTAELKDETPVTDFVRAMQEQLMNSMANDACAFAELAAEYGVTADMMLVYQGDMMHFGSLCGLPAELMPVMPGAAKAPFTLNIELNDNRFDYTLEYRKDLYSAAFGEALADAVAAAARAFVSCETLGDVTMSSRRSEALYAKLNDNGTPIEPVTAVALLEKWAPRQPDKTAVIAAGETLTFRELNEAANRVAHRLLELGVGRDHIIGMVLERTVEVPVTEFGIQKAGGAFLGMLPSYPDERIEFCLTNADSPFVITTRAILEARPGLFGSDKPYKALAIEDLLTGEDVSDPGLSLDPEQLAYCIYTSGSTGTPKGVMLTHGNLSNYLQTVALPRRFYQREDCTGSTLAVASVSFDMSLDEIYMALCAGKTLCIATEDEIHDPAALAALMLKSSVQCMTCTPSYLNSMVDIPVFAEAARGLVTLVVGAEAFPDALYDKLKALAPDLQILNGYGPTETTICCSMKELGADRRITIGRPAGNLKFFVADKKGHILPPYACGELIICGPAVGRGYVKLPEKTAASFFHMQGLPAYHSGDLVRLNGDAEIDFGGRLDNQVKLRGFRVELDEIEKVLCQFDTVKQAKVIVRNNGSEDYLAGFFTAASPVDLEALTAFLKSRLTYYMVPAVLMQLEQMPMTSNGKVDKKALPETTRTTQRRTGRKAPRKSMEQRLCEVFANVLGQEEVFADDSFFELGGTSLTASKVTMMLMSDNIEVKYGDIFDHPTPEDLADFLQARDRQAKATQISAPSTETFSRAALHWNTVKYAPEVERKPLGNVLLTGATGFLGIHILRELLELEDGHIWCLIRRGRHETAEIRLRTMLVYYFSDGFAEALRDRITVVEADITDKNLGDALADVPFDTVINCAACVKHFTDDDILERINVHGVENLIDICLKRNARLVQISTVSVCGIHTPETYEKQLRMHENELFVVDDMGNKYGISKYHAELKMLDAIESGLRGKIVRVGNLMGRHSDGEFQANIETNMFLSGIRGFATMGKYPISHMTDPMRFSPIDCTARAVVLLAGTNDKFTAFNCDNRYGFDEMKIIDACNRNGITIVPTRDEDYYAEFQQKLGDDQINARLNGLAAYDIKDAHTVDTDNRFTTNILYRIGFSWPLVDDAYLDRAIRSILTLDYFGTEEGEG